MLGVALELSCLRLLCIHDSPSSRSTEVLKTACVVINPLSCVHACVVRAAEPSGPAAAESPMTTLGRIRSFAPTAAKLADSKGEYLSAIKSRRQEEAAARKEREVRRASSRCNSMLALHVKAV